eukprot:TRINITY_DN4599_c0_g1_i5.p1 TRINITY_DN4599_c0_g1~~TRINITY_DN4599_c0_g1_i5.p1  ORF type:complete len:136 (-),score=19.96 TRINITY_DN4599_c0_g1_i5:193-600(-)
MVLSLNKYKLPDDLLLTEIKLLPEQSIEFTTLLKGGGPDTLYPEDCWDCFCVAGERVHGCITYRFLLHPIWIHDGDYNPKDCSVFCFRWRCGDGCCTCGCCKGDETGEISTKVYREKAKGGSGVYYGPTPGKERD